MKIVIGDGCFGDSLGLASDGAFPAGDDGAAGFAGLAAGFGLGTKKKPTSMPPSFDCQNHRYTSL
jgi:hypothetical protein